ncbi:hypothetical protein DEA8626_03197 [Defluviimonas aquaemixtae]|uniref:Uncharacterized protein n=1 Tax=Albidovulum aquaemixtae TaxID=1542388 RepID=A0A2R8BL85_9RHOB|nr:hypothetical protein [Defluviimonas aquaemixtae]SPH24148.1 hypothetical protein DEA8626_03197 [Defluviimonas aquaemixtae]
MVNGTKSGFGRSAPRMRPFGKTYGNAAGKGRMRPVNAPRADEDAPSVVVVHDRPEDFIDEL